MAEVKILVEGNHKAADDHVYIGSTVTLVKSDGKNIVVDTSHLWNERKVIDALRAEGLSPEDIDILVLAHTHLDHTANAHLFKNAKIYAKFTGGYPGQFHSIPEKCIVRFEIGDGIKVAHDVEYLFTPGHSADSLSLVVKTKRGTIVIAGDAIASEEWADETKLPNPNWIFDLGKYKESRAKILKTADYVIPGHGGMFKVKK